MKTWYIRVGKKSSPDIVYEDVVDAPTAEEAAKGLEQGPVRFWYKGDVYSQYVGQKYLYEVREL